MLRKRKNKCFVKEKNDILAHFIKKTGSLQNFIQHEDEGVEKNIIIFAITTNLEIVAKSECIICDITFYSAPKEFSQLSHFFVNFKIVITPLFFHY